MAMLQEEILKLLNKSFPGDKIYLENLSGDQDHYSLLIESKRFIGKKLIEQHKMVYQALGDCMGEELHALSIKTKEVV